MILFERENLYLYFYTFAGPRKEGDQQEYRTAAEKATEAGPGAAPVYRAGFGRGAPAPQFNMRLKVYKAISVIAESALADPPIATSVPSLALASGPSLLIYKNLKPFYKFTTPSSKVNRVEEEVWARAQQSDFSSNKLIAVLRQLALEISVKNLSAVSQTLLTLPEDERDAFVQKYASKGLSNPSTITCVTTMKRSSAETLDVLICGTERGQVHVVDSQAFSVVMTYKLQWIPSHLIALGTYDVEYRIFVVTRNGKIYSLSREDQTCSESAIIECNCPIVDLVIHNRSLAVANTDKTLSFFTMKGRRLNRIKINEEIRALEQFVYVAKQLTGVIVQLESELRIYNEHYLLDVITFDKPISWVKYGEYGREDGALLVGNKEGGLSIRLFRRKAAFEEKVYQKDAFLLKYETTKRFTEIAQVSTSVSQTATALPIDMTVDVNGFGPTFRLTVHLTSSAKVPLYKHYLSLLSPPSMYIFSQPLVPVPLLIPGKEFTYTSLVTCPNPEKGLQSDIKLVLCNETSTTPLLTVVIAMPISDLNVLD
ncbi:hypothetical protein WR25_21261 isoform B [Diploscapter pachys]|uniref:Bardet-Biedl syndrome 1 N-terminal domain-containing protein n=1 Tax=Diploscapter pachys TaxID=2018661 RepID=A0A2A2JDK6_9BILA|nr:hypothetical protein WR25_21261 isoform A [Diploscapter pachys]PAV59669.1 hypothetical protein WR25_21261 isoform B [Diploscapter pachys]